MSPLNFTTFISGLEISSTDGVTYKSPAYSENSNTSIAPFLTGKVEGDPRCVFFHDEQYHLANSWYAVHFLTALTFLILVLFIEFAISVKNVIRVGRPESRALTMFLRNARNLSLLSFACGVVGVGNPWLFALQSEVPLFFLTGCILLPIFARDRFFDDHSSDCLLVTLAFYSAAHLFIYDCTSFYALKYLMIGIFWGCAILDVLNVFLTFVAAVVRPPVRNHFQFPLIIPPGAGVVQATPIGDEKINFQSRNVCDRRLTVDVLQHSKNVVSLYLQELNLPIDKRRVTYSARYIFSTTLEELGLPESMNIFLCKFKDGRHGIDLNAFKVWLDVYLPDGAWAKQYVLDNYTKLFPTGEALLLFIALARLLPEAAKITRMTVPVYGPLIAGILEALSMMIHLALIDSDPVVVSRKVANLQRTIQETELPDDDRFEFEAFFALLKAMAFPEERVQGGVISSITPSKRASSDPVVLKEKLKEEFDKGPSRPVTPIHFPLTFEDEDTEVQAKKPMGGPMVVLHFFFLVLLQIFIWTFITGAITVCVERFVPWLQFTVNNLERKWKNFSSSDYVPFRVKMWWRSFLSIPTKKCVTVYCTNRVTLISYAVECEVCAFQRFLNGVKPVFEVGRTNCPVCGQVKVDELSHCICCDICSRGGTFEHNYIPSSSLAENFPGLNWTIPRPPLRVDDEFEVTDTTQFDAPQTFSSDNAHVQAGDEELSFTSLLHMIGDIKNDPLAHFLSDIVFSAVAISNSNSRSVILSESCRLLINHYDLSAAAYAEASNNLVQLFGIEVQVDAIEDRSLEHEMYGLFSALSVTAVLSKLGAITGHYEVASVLKSIESLCGTKSDTFILRFFRFLQVFVQKIVACIREGSLSPLVSSTLTPSQWLRISTTLIRDERIRKSCSEVKFTMGKDKGEIPAFFSTQLDDEDRVLRAINLAEYGEALSKKGSGSEDILGIVPEIRNMVRSLRAFVTDEYNRKSRTSYRPTPLGIYIYGVPDVGKSTLVSAIGDIVAVQHNAVSGTDITYQVDPTKNFWDGVSPSHLVMILDDTDQSPAKPAYADNTFVKCIIELINTKPFNAEQAALEKKGEVFLRPTLVGHVTNTAPHKSCIETLAKHPTAFFRRFKFSLEIKVKPERANPAGGIRPDIPVDDDTWIFKVSKWAAPADTASANPTYYTLDHVFYSRMNFLKWLSRTYAKHISEGTKFSEEMNKEVSGCVYCNVPTKYHFELCKPLVPIIELPPLQIVQADSPSLVSQFRSSPDRKPDPYVGAVVLLNILYVLHVASMLYNMYFVVVMFELSAFLVAHYVANNEKAQKAIVIWMMSRNFFEAGLGMVGGYLLSTTVKCSVWDSICIPRIASRLSRFKVPLEKVLVVISMLLAGRFLWNVGKKVLTPKVEVQNMVLTEEEKVVTPAGNSNVYHRTIRPSPYPEVVNTASLEQLADILPKVVAKASRGSRSLWAWYYGGNVWMVPLHLFRNNTLNERVVPLPETDFSLDITYRGQVYPVVMRSGRNMEAISGRDEVAMFIPNIVVTVTGLKKFCFPAELNGSARFDNMVLCVPSLSGLNIEIEPISSPSAGRYATQSSSATSGSKFYVSHGVKTKVGDCGSLLFAKYQSGIKLLGMHVIEVNTLSTTYGCAEPALYLEIDEAVAKMSLDHSRIKPSDIMVAQSGQLTPNYKMEGAFSDVVLHPIPENRSSLYSVARDGKFGCAILGTLPKFRAASFKSKLSPNPWKEAMVKLGSKYGLELPFIVPYEKVGMHPTELPDGKIEERWRDPYTNFFRKCDNVDGPFAPLDWAYIDYMSQLRLHFDELKNVRPFSLYEALRGDEEGFLNSVNLQTSTGLPYNRKKKDFIRWIAEENNIDVEISDILLQEIQACEEALRDPDVVVMFCFNSTEKDESIDRDKCDASGLRIFWCGSVVFNILLAMYTGPAMAFLQRHSSDAEHAIGYNICSPQLDNIMAKKLEYAGSYSEPSTLCGDLKCEDGKSSTQMLGYSTSVPMEILEATAYTPTELNISRKLFCAAIRKILLVKGDIAIVSFMNPSGWLWTAMINSIINAILQRASYFISWKSVNPTLPPSYRSVAVAQNMGDDNDITVKQDARKYINYPSLQRGYAKYGQVYTSSDKSLTFTADLDPLSDASFLKRTYRFDETVKHWLAPLSLKSIFKMQMFNMRSAEASVLEVQRATFRSAVSELFFHGEEVYHDLVPQMIEAIGNEEVTDGYPSYDVLRDRYLKGESVWFADSSVIDIPSDAVITVQSGLSDGATTEFEGRSISETIPMPNAPTLPVEEAFASKMQLENILQRKVRIATLSLSSTDVAAAHMTNMDLISTWITNPVVASKMSYYWYWRGGFEITVVVECSPTHYGGYLLALVYNNNDDLNAASNNVNDVKFHTAHQLPNAIINPAMSNNVQFKVPFISNQTATTVTLASDVSRPRPHLNLFCISPLREASNAAATVTGSIAIYMSALPDMELGGALIQARNRPSRVSGALTTASSIAASVASMVPSLSAFATPISLGLAAGSSLASAMGWTRNRAPEETKMVFTARGPMIGPSDGTDHSMGYSITHKALTTIDPAATRASDSTDETSFAFLWDRATCIDIYSWSDTDPALKVLACIPVTPALCAVNGSSWAPSPMAMVGAPWASMWRGRLIYDLHIVCSAMHSGAVQLIWSPTPLTVGSTLVNDPTNMSVGCILDISADLNQSVTVGWSHFRNMANFVLGAVGSSFGQDAINGYFAIVVASPLRGPASATAKIHVAYRADSDLVIGGLRPYTSATLTTSLQHTCLLQAAIADPEPDKQCFIGTGIGSVIPVDLLFTGELIGSVRALAQVFSLAYSATTTWSSGPAWRREVTYNIPFYPQTCASGTAALTYGAYNNAAVVVNDFNGDGLPTTFPSSNGTTGKANLLGWIRTMYLGVRGGMLVKMIPISNGATYTVQPNVKISKAFSYVGFRREMANSYCNDSWVDNFAPKGFPSSNGVSEFYLPYNDSRRWYPSWFPQDYTKPLGKWICFLFTLENYPTTGGFSSSIYVAGAADINFVHFRHTPLIVPPSGGAAMMMSPPEGDEEMVFEGGEGSTSDTI
jgi:hypothetical protein